MRLTDSGRLLAIVERRENGLQDLGGGERPAGLRLGADLGVDTVGLVGVVGLRGVTVVDFTVVRTMREVLKGLQGSLAGSRSSSSAPRLRLVDCLKVVGSIFSESTSDRGCLFPERMAPIVMYVSYNARDEHGAKVQVSIPSCLFFMFILVLSKERMRGASKLANGCRIVVGVMVRAAML